MRKILSLLIVFQFFSFVVFAQTTKLGTPKSWSQKNLSNREIPTLNLPSFDLDAQLRADAINEANKIGPWRFGYEHSVNVGLTNGGTWTQLPNGDRIWRASFHSNGALSMNILFDKFVLPEGATVFIYNYDRTQYDGAYTSANNNSDEILGTSLIKGENLIVEYYEPSRVAGLGKLNIGTVIHGYKSLSLYAENLLKGLNDSGNCNQDVKCPLGTGWQNQINSVAIIIVGGSGACTGALVNNTSNDGTPYFLSANHCGTTGLGNWVFRFNWDSPVAVCSQNANSQDPGAPYNQVNGAALRSNSAGSDFALMRLNATPTGNIYYAGWSRSTTPATQVTAIHHPSGDVKKISRENQAVTTATWSGAQTWRIANWDLGTTEPGSSGSPLFDQNQRIIGQLYGGGAACSGLANNGQPDYYGRFDISWTGGGTNTTRLSNWLDPSGTNATSIDGYDPNATGIANDAGLQQVVNLSGSYCNQSSFTPELAMKNFGTSVLTSAVISYRVDAGSVSNYNWSGSLSPGATTTVTLPSITISTSGAHTYSATVTSPNGQLDSNAVNNTANSSFNVVLNGLQASLTVLTDCWGSETTWQVADSSGNVILSGGPYSDGTPTVNLSTLCLSEGCYVLTVEDSYSDGVEGSLYTQCGVDGNYFIIDQNGDSVVTMTNPGFGASVTHNFCISNSIPSSIENQQIDNFEIYPNPNNGQFVVAAKLAQEKDVEIQVYNTLGQLITKSILKNVSVINEEINISNTSSGMYYINILSDNEIQTKIISKK